MRIYTMTQERLIRIPSEIKEPVYIENIPYSLQQKLNIYGNVCICRDLGTVVLYNGSKGNGFTGNKVKKVISVINGFSKSNNYFHN